MDMKKDNRISCKVENCVYHDCGDTCRASHINVGPQHASTSQDTVCSTFKPEDKKGCC